MNNTHRKYAALCCYFGQWPSHFGHWLKSCSYNDQIDFFMVSDIPLKGYVVPGNVHIHNMSFAQVQELIRQKFPMLNVSVDRPYKLCDFKTAYGYIFEDLFAGYDYWGFYDIDTLWGDILRFIPENADLHLVKIFPCGHLSFIRNVAPWNKIYELVNQIAGTPCRNNMEGRKVETWQTCFSSSESHYYDEEGGLEPMLEALEKNPSSLATYTGVDFDNVLPPWRFDHFLSINYPEKSNHLVYGFDEGHLYRFYLKDSKVQREEISYVHFSKRQVSVTVPPDCGRFSLYPNVITHWKDWSYLSLLLHGRKRYLHNILRRLLRKVGI